MGAAWVFVPGSDLKLTKGGPVNAVIGGPISYTLKVTNNGPSNVTNVVLSDPTPAGTTLVSAIPTQGTCNSSVSCNLGSLASGNTATVTILVRATSVGTVRNTAVVAAAEFDPDLSNNRATATTAVAGVCDREVRKTVSPTTVQTGGTTTITLAVRNVGSAPCAPVGGYALLDTKPAGLTFLQPVTGAPAGWSCGLNPNFVFCIIGAPLPVGGVATIVFNAKVTAAPGSSVTNCAQLNAPDANAANDRACATVTVPGPPCVTPPANMVAWWPLDERAGATTLQDLSGGNNATPFASPVGGAQAPQPVAGIVGGAVDFPKFGNGLSGARVSPQPALAAVGSANFTIDAWVKSPSAPADRPHYIVNRFDPASNKGYALYVVSPGTAGNDRLVFKWGDGSSLPSTTGVPLTAGQWHHVAVTFARNTGGNALDIRLFVDGAERGSSISNPVGGVGSLATFLTLEIGWQPSSVDEPIAIDELEIFSRALSQSELGAIANAGSSGKCKPDFGDAPDSYGTTLGSGGARHLWDTRRPAAREPDRRRVERCALGRCERRRIWPGARRRGRRDDHRPERRQRRDRSGPPDRHDHRQARRLDRLQQERRVRRRRERADLRQQVDLARNELAHVLRARLRGHHGRLVRALPCQHRRRTPA